MARRKALRDRFKALTFATLTDCHAFTVTFIYFGEICLEHFIQTGDIQYTIDKELLPRALLGGIKVTFLQKLETKTENCRV